MSNILNCKTSADCKPWRAPDLNVTEEIAFDYKLSDSEHTTHNKQQSKIRQQAYEKSYANGYMEGLAQGQKEIAKQVNDFQSLITAITMPLPDLDNQVVDEMLQLCIAIVKQMVRRELKMAPDEVMAVIKEALSILPATAAEVTLELHPEDAELVRNSLINPDSQSNWRIIEDPLLTRGGCRVLTSTSRIDATVESRINTVIAEILGDERKRD